MAWKHIHTISKRVGNEAGTQLDLHIVILLNYICIFKPSVYYLGRSKLPEEFLCHATHDTSLLKEGDSLSRMTTPNLSVPGLGQI